MNKLELKHLAPYRNHKLKFVMTCDHTEEFDFEAKDFKKGSIWQYAGEIDYDLYIPLGDGDISRVFRKGSQYISIISKGMKPILHPLSDLTNPITVEGYNDGKEFVPIDEMLSIVGKSLNHLTEEAKQKAYIVFANDVSNKTLPYKYFELLLKWHFDIFDLLSNNLAVSYNDIKL